MSEQHSAIDPSVLNARVEEGRKRHEIIMGDHPAIVMLRDEMRSLNARAAAVRGLYLLASAMLETVDTREQAEIIAAKINQEIDADV